MIYIYIYIYITISGEGRFKPKFSIMDESINILLVLYTHYSHKTFLVEFKLLMFYLTLLGSYFM